MARNGNLKDHGPKEGKPMFPTTLFMFVGTVISLVMVLDFLRPLRKTHPF